tara:strand:- start:7910 stop:8440 length:531 start_codon:yes stop_codon:yes gene_type:complete
MKKIVSIYFLLYCVFSYAQNEYPQVLSFDVKIKEGNSTDKSNTINETYHFLMLNSHEAIDLRAYGNKECEFKIIGHHLNKIILTYNQPSKLIKKGMCAAGIEKGILYLELDDDNTILKSQLHLLESCLLSIEVIKEKKLDETTTEYLLENQQTSVSYYLIVNSNNATVTKSIFKTD